MKRLLFLSVFIIFCVSLCPIAVFAVPPINILIDGTPLVTDVPPIKDNGRILVPLRAISETLSAKVDWDGEANMVMVFNGNMICLLTIDNPNVIVISADHTEVIRLDAPPTIKDGRTLLPIRFFAEFFNCGVDWELQDDQELVTITKSK